MCYCYFQGKSAIKIWIINKRRLTLKSIQRIIKIFTYKDYFKTHCTTTTAVMFVTVKTVGEQLTTTTTN
jgi:hypothetical protein